MIYEERIYKIKNLNAVELNRKLILSVLNKEKVDDLKFKILIYSILKTSYSLFRSNDYFDISPFKRKESSLLIEKKLIDVTNNYFNKK